MFRILKTPPAAALAILLATPSTSGCQGKDAAQCQEALAGIRSALSKSDVTAAKTLRDAGYKHCKLNVMTSVDKDIVQAEAVQAQEQDRIDAAQAESDALLDLLSTLAESAAASDTGAATPNAQCVSDGQEAICTSTRRVQGKPHEIALVYLKEQPKAFRYTTQPTGDFSCASLGPHTVARTWGAEGKKRQHCSFADGKLRGLEALTRQGTEERSFSVFSPEFRRTNSELRSELRGEPQE